jgi:stage III sporulation protein AE
MPTVSLLFTFTAVVGACPDSHLGGVLSGVRKFIGRLWSVFGILFSFLLSVQTLLAGAADSLGARTARFALSSFVPVAGGMIAEALSTLRGGMAYVRQTAGVGGILVLLALFLPAVIPMVLVKLALSLTESAAGILGVGAASSMLGEVRGIAELIIGVVTGASLVFLITLMMFMKVWSG